MFMDDGPTTHSFRGRRDDLGVLIDSEFVGQTRLTKDAYRDLHSLLEPANSPLVYRNHAISSHTRLQTTLRFLAQGNLYQSNSGLYHVSKGSTSAHIHKVVSAIVDKVIFVKVEITEALRKYFGLIGILDR